MKNHVIAMFFIILAVMGNHAISSDSPAVLSMDEKGVFSMDGIRIYVVVFAPEWKFSSQAISLREIKNTSEEISAVMDTAAGTLFFTQTTKSTKAANGSEGWDVSYRLRSDTPVPAEAVILSVALPAKDFAGRAITADGQTYTLPVEFAGEQTVPFADKAQQIKIPSPKGDLVISGKDMILYLQDDRKYDMNTYTLRISFIGDVKSISSLYLNIGLVVQDTGVQNK